MILLPEIMIHQPAIHGNGIQGQASDIRIVMNFILGQLGQVLLIIACAIGGTVGILKLIKHFSPNGEFTKDPIAKKLEEQSKK